MGHQRISVLFSGISYDAEKQRAARRQIFRQQFLSASAPQGKMRKDRAAGLSGIVQSMNKDIVEKRVPPGEIRQRNKPFRTKNFEILFYRDGHRASQPGSSGYEDIIMLFALIALIR